jgi:hypothetical protein
MAVEASELAWAAGFFDGEGCTSVTSCRPKKRALNQDRPMRGLRASLAQVELEPLLRFHRAVGVGAVRGPYKYGTNKHPYFQWNASNMDVIEVIDRLWPYLSTVKKKQALDNIDKYEEYLEKYPPKVNQFDRT